MMGLITHYNFDVESAPDAKTLTEGLRQVLAGVSGTAGPGGPAGSTGPGERGGEGEG
jgi:hypothetical protein